MTETLSAFWHWFIIIPVVLGLIGCWWLVWATSRGSREETTETVGHVWDEDLEELNNPLPRWWLNLFYITLIAAAIYLLLYPGLGNFAGLLGWTQIGKYERELADADERYGPLFRKFANTQIDTLAGDPNAMASGARLFSTYCTTCHGSDARGATGFPNLTDQAWLYGGSPEQIKTSIVQGRAGVMPGWEAALGAQGIKEVVNYIQLLNQQEHDQELARKGQVNYGNFCIGCHGADATGNPALGAPDLTDRAWLYGDSTEALTKTIALGRTGLMPAHGEFLGDDKAHLLAAYVWSLSNKNVTENSALSK